MLTPILCATSVKIFWRKHFPEILPIGDEWQGFLTCRVENPLLVFPRYFEQDINLSQWLWLSTKNYQVGIRMSRQVCYFNNNWLDMETSQNGRPFYGMIGIRVLVHGRGVTR